MSIDESSGEPTRRRAPLDTITADPDAKVMVDAFVSPDARLLQTGSDDDHAYVEVAHEALLRSWTRLVNWIDTTREDQLTIKRMEREAALWAERGKPDHMLPNAESIGEFEAACTRLGREVTDPTLLAFTEPEQERLYRELEDITTTHQRRFDIGERLARTGDYRPSLYAKDGVPDISWLPIVSSGEIKIGERRFAVSPFYIARYLTTFSQFQAFINSGEYDDSRWWKDFPVNYQPKNPIIATNSNHNAPRDTISWYQSVAFGRWISKKLHGLRVPCPSRGVAFHTCKFLDAKLAIPEDDMWVIGENAEIRLPTEWEWQWAAQGEAEKRNYPWGDWQHGYANTTEAGINDRSTACGMYPQGAAACGAMDMAGNLWEWCLNKPSNPEQIAPDFTGDYRVLRGGSFNDLSSWASTTHRNSNDPNRNSYKYGVRLVVGIILD